MSTKYTELAKEIGALVDEKNKAYGNSFEQAGEFLKLLYPDGIKPEQYGNMLSLVRIFDKLKRIATDKDAFGEDPFSDIVGYGLLAVEKNKREKGKTEKQLLLEKLEKLENEEKEKLLLEAKQHLAKFDLTSPYAYKSVTVSSSSQVVMAGPNDSYVAVPEYVHPSERCGQVISGHHTETCVLKKGHKENCSY